jgi:hypothetical protein
MTYRVELGPQVRPGVWEWTTQAPAGSLSGVSSEPLLDACREIKRAGGDTRRQACLFREGRSEWDLRCSVGWGARHTVSDKPSESPRFAKYEPPGAFSFRTPVPSNPA